MQPSPSATVLAWWAQQQPGALFITTVTVAEILYGIELLPHGKRRADLLAGAERMFGKVLVGALCLSTRTPRERSQRSLSGAAAQGRPIADLDAQIAAITHSRNAILATRNTADFEGCGVRLVNPWQPSES